MAEKGPVLHPGDPSAAWEPLFQALSLPHYRVHEQNRIALIQAPPEDYERLLRPEVRAALLQHGRSLGYLFVTLDMTYEA